MAHTWLFCWVSHRAATPLHTALAMQSVVLDSVINQPGNTEKCCWKRLTFLSFFPSLLAMTSHMTGGGRGQPTVSLSVSLAPGDGLLTFFFLVMAFPPFWVNYCCINSINKANRFNRYLLEFRVYKCTYVQFLFFNHTRLVIKELCWAISFVGFFFYCKFLNDNVILSPDAAKKQWER